MEKQRDRAKKIAPDLRSEVLADRASDQGHQKNLKRYAKAKQHQVDVASYILQHEPTMGKEHEALSECSQTLIFRHWYTVGEYRLIGGCTCKKHLLCAMCALRRSAKTVREVEKKILTVLSENPHLVPVLLTTTVKNAPDLGERYEHITSSKKKLLQSRRNALKAKKIRLCDLSVTRFIHGSFGSYEFKQGAGGHGWHPHSHEIALLDPSVDIQDFQKKLSSEWQHLTGDSFIVDARRIHVETTRAKAGSVEFNQDDLLGAICEASKYALKLNEMTHEDQIHAYKVLRGRRLTFTYGSLWGIKIPDDLNDDIQAELELLPYVDLVYSFYSGKYDLSSITDTEDTLVKSNSKKLLKEKKNNRLPTAELKYGDAVREFLKKRQWQEAH